MPTDVAALAATIVSSFLVPYVKAGVVEIGKELSKKVGDSAAAQVTGLTQKLWDRIRSVFAEEDDRGALSQFEKRPELAKALIQSILEEKLENDSSLARELDELINTPAQDGLGSITDIMNNSGLAGVVNVNNSDFRHSTGTTIVGVSVQAKPDNLPFNPKRDRENS
jgi:hypothetical protein